MKNFLSHHYVRLGLDRQIRRKGIYNRVTLFLRLERHIKRDTYENRSSDLFGPDFVPRISKTLFYPSFPAGLRPSPHSPPVLVYPG